MLHEHKFPLPLWEKEKKVRQRAMKGSISRREKRERVAGRRQLERQGAGFLRLPLLRSEQGQLIAPTALHHVLPVQLGEAVEVVELGYKVLREVRQPTPILSPQIAAPILNIDRVHVSPVDGAPAMVHIDEAFGIFAPGVAPLPDFPQLALAVEGYHIPAFPGLGIDSHEHASIG